MGINPNEFWNDYTYADIQRRIHYHRLERINLHRERWEQTRSIIYYTVSMNTTKDVKPIDVMSFPWDNEELSIEEKKKATRMSPEEVQKLLEIHKLK